MKSWGLCQKRCHPKELIYSKILSRIRPWYLSQTKHCVTFLCKVSSFSTWPSDIHHHNPGTLHYITVNPTYMRLDYRYNNETPSQTLQYPCLYTMTINKPSCIFCVVLYGLRSKQEFKKIGKNSVLTFGSRPAWEGTRIWTVRRWRVKSLDLGWPWRHFLPW